MSVEKLKLLYIDDEPRNLELFTCAFKREYSVFCAGSASDGIGMLRRHTGFPVIIVDQRMPKMTGIEFIDEIKTDFPDAVIIILTAYVDHEVLIDAINAKRVYRYIVKPWDKNELRQTLKSAFNQHLLSKENKELLFRLKETNSSLLKTLNELKKANVQVEQLKNQFESEAVYLREEINNEHDFHEIVGESINLKSTLSKVKQVSVTNTTVLILGETGTGKELFARAIHNTSCRRDRSLVKVNCSALPANLIESELFGHEKGSFTGAFERRIGRFELADKGTIFLDEIGDMPLELQVKLLRVLQESEFERLGSAETKKVDVRVIAATNRNLEKAVNDGDFREDLFYRLNVFPIKVPPLRERKEDIPAIAFHFMSRFCKKTGKRIDKIPENVIDSLISYDWKGNVRELENIIERAVILTNGLELELEGSIKLPLTANNHNKKDLVTLKEMEITLIVKALEKSDGVIQGKNGAAANLGIPPSTLRDRIKEYKIKKPVFSDS